jgi:NitT/TauT family transport system permease protein
MNKKIISNERKEYLRKIRKNKFMVLFTQIFILMLFLGIWEVLANNGVIDSFITSSPSRILKTFMNLSSNDLVKHILVTTYETVIGFLIGTSLGVLIAIILWWSDFLSKVFDPYLVVLNSLPKVALRTNNYNLGRSRNTSNYSNGCCNFFSCNNT